MAEEVTAAEAVAAEEVAAEAAEAAEEAEVHPVDNLPPHPRPRHQVHLTTEEG